MAGGNVATGGIGQPVLRKEDLRLVVGKGQYASDQFPEGAAHAAFLRAPHAHARILKIDVASAKAAPGVIAVFTGADLLGGGMNPIPHNPNWDGMPDVTLHFAPGYEVFLTRHMPMPAEIVRYVGEPVAAVIAETQTQARDAAEKIVIEWEVLPAVARAMDALKTGAPAIWSERANNISLEAEVGDKAKTDAAFARAAHVTRLETWIKRISGNPMEPRVAIGDFDATSGVYTIWAGSGGGMIKERQQLAGVLGVPLEKCRAMCKDMGGNFGTRNTFFPEYGVLPWAAKRVGRPIKWVAERTECLLSDYQGRDLHVDAEIALDKDGKFLAVRGVNTSNIGAYTAHYTPLRKGLGIMSGVYDIPTVHFRGRAVFTNTIPTTPYRSAGRPEAIYVIERLVDMAAREHGFDPAELRRRNFIAPEAMPFTNAVGITYDNGEYERVMDMALKLAKWSGFAERRARSKAKGLLRGIGIANYIEGAGGSPRERAEVTVGANGRVELVLGTMNSGQGHETSFAQLLDEWLGVPFESIDYVAHDTNRVSAGGGSHSGRSMRIASLAIGEASDAVIAKGKAIASYMLEVAPTDIEFRRGDFSVKGSDLCVNIFEVAKAAATRTDLPEDLRGKLDGVGDHVVKVGAFPSGTHICEVEIDPQTGFTRLVDWFGVDDVGLAINPMILHGQTHGAIAQGVGQAAMENVFYDPANGQMLSASFMDYAMPRAGDLPSYDCELVEVPATSHKFGIRPGGEGGTTPALGAYINAVCDALAEVGVRHVEMPATAQTVWKAIRDARSA
jgi:carbon-monoxide dehydrogenase large subunit